MSDSIRSLIVTAVVAALNASPAGPVTFRDSPNEQHDGEGGDVFQGTDVEAPVRGREGAPDGREPHYPRTGPVIKHRLHLQVECRADGRAACDRIAAFVEQRLTDHKLGGQLGVIAIWIDSVVPRYERQSNASLIRTLITVSVIVDYAAARTDPTKAA